MKHQTVVIPASGDYAVGRHCRDVHLEYPDGTRLHYHGQYSDGSTVNPNDLAAIARAAGASGIEGRTVEVDNGFVNGFTTYSGIGYGR